MKFLNLSQRGISLMEALISLAIASIAIMALTGTLSSIYSQKSRVMLRINSRLAALKITSAIFSNPGNFPTLTMGSNIGIYIFCYDLNGNTVPGSEAGTVDFLSSPNEVSSVCPSITQFEVRAIPPGTSLGSDFHVDVYDYRSLEGQRVKLSSRKVVLSHGF